MWSYGLGRDLAYPSGTLGLPGEDEVRTAWQQYRAQLGSRPPGPGDRVEQGDSRIRVRGLSSVIAVNGVLSRQIFERNRDTHTFYAEESYVLPWMYDYAEPFGLILRLNAEPWPLLDRRVLARDRRYWDTLANELRANVQYQRDLAAQRTLAKLRATIAGLYAYRGLTAEAEYAFRQALLLCPESFDASYRLSQLYVGLNRMDDALTVLTDYQQHDRYNARIQDAIAGLTRRREPAGGLRHAP
jgi:tetratricopeptide (TPR) repeat protein